jgi:hypothetical protein
VAGSLKTEKDAQRMGLFGFLKKRSQPIQKTYPLSQPGVMDLVTEVCSILKMQFSLLNQLERGIPQLVKNNGSNNKPIVELWLLGYLSGFYDAFSQFRECEFELNALELIYSVFYGEKDAAAAIHEYHIARITLGSDREAALLFGYDEFEEGMLAGGNNVFDWASRRIESPLGIYKRYS